MKRIVVVVLIAIASACAPPPPNSERVAVLVTAWGEPDGFDPIYRREVTSRTYGDNTDPADEPCTYMHVGEYPYASQLGMLPYALAFPVERLEGAYDSFGFYRLSEDGETYISVFDPEVAFAKADLPDVPGLVKPAIGSATRTQRSLWGIDPRDGTNYIDDIWMIGAASRKSPNPLAFPNGIRDLDEISLIASIADFNVLFEDQTPRMPEAHLSFDYKTADVLEDLFGKLIDVRFGAYAPNSGLMPTHEDVAVNLAEAGFRRMVVARETTDNNNYANNFMSLGYADKALCRAGYEGQVEYQQVRQIGRTPEYNAALMETLRPHLQRLEPGVGVTILYATYGLPWPGGNPKGPFAQPHPWAKEVYHENAYNNYIAFKRYAEEWYGDRWKLGFNYDGTSGDRRVDNYFGYTMYKPDLLQSYGLYVGDQAGQDLAKATRFKTLREQVDRAKAEGRDELIVVYSHWLNNTRDTLLAGRILQEFPLNSREDFRNDKYWIDWCERAGSAEPVDCDGDDVIHIQLTEAFRQGDRPGRGWLRAAHSRRCRAFRRVARRDRPRSAGARGGHEAGRRNRGTRRGTAGRHAARGRRRRTPGRPRRVRLADAYDLHRSRRQHDQRMGRFRSLCRPAARVDPEAAQACCRCQRPGAGRPVPDYRQPAGDADDSVRRWQGSR